MADAKKYLDLQGLTTYDGKIKGYVNEKESALERAINSKGLSFISFLSSTFISFFSSITSLCLALQKGSLSKSLLLL